MRVKCPSSTHKFTREFSPTLQKLTSGYVNLRIPGQIQLGRCRYDDPRSGSLFLAPHSVGRLALVLMGTSVESLRDVISLATPTIPPMTRSPVSGDILLIFELVD